MPAGLNCVFVELDGQVVAVGVGVRESGRRGLGSTGARRGGTGCT